MINSRSSNESRNGERRTRRDGIPPLSRITRATVRTATPNRSAIDAHDPPARIAKTISRFTSQGTPTPGPHFGAFLTSHPRLTSVVAMTD